MNSLCSLLACAALWAPIFGAALVMTVDDAPQTPAPATGAGKLRCSIRLIGEAPQPPEIVVDKTIEHCGAELRDPVLVVDGSAVANVVVSIDLPRDAIASSLTQPTQAELKLEMEGCLMKPRVQCARKGDRLALHNKDKVAHNPHAWLTAGQTAFNLALINDRLTIRRTLSEATVYRVDCDTHSWMRAYIHVFDHPWYDVTGSDGIAELESIPAGPQTVRVWHEVLGTVTREVTIKPNETIELEIQLDLKDCRPPKLVPPGMRPWIPREHAK